MDGVTCLFLGVLLLDAEDCAAVGGDLDVERSGKRDLITVEDVVDGARLVRQLEGWPGNVPNALIVAEVEDGDVSSFLWFAHLSNPGTPWHIQSILLDEGNRNAADAVLIDFKELFIGHEGTGCVIEPGEVAAKDHWGSGDGPEGEFGAFFDWVDA